MRRALRAVRRLAAPWADRLPRPASRGAQPGQTGVLVAGSDPFDLGVDLLVGPGATLDGLPAG
ncbi:MAG: hypothetical protein FWF90_17540, partial [Promicromonosporaceae bacterium]|nr:hypothetical protein [Promicromonosporaceae bacterium]